MAVPILMPKLSFVVTQGTVIEWLKEPGDPVTKGEPLLVIESEKATIDVESPGTGILGPDLAPKGLTVPVTTIIGYILEPGESPPKLDLNLAGVAQQQVAATTKGGEDSGQTAIRERVEVVETSRIKASPSARRLAREKGIDLSKIQGSGPGGRIVQEDVQACLHVQAASVQETRLRATPVARKLAAELKVDLGSVKGTGPGGRVTKEDVARASQATAPQLASQPALTPAAQSGFEWVELTPIQRVTAERMTLSFGTAPHFYLAVHMDMSQAVVLRQALLPVVEAKVGVRLSFTDILLYAVSRALAAHPSLNAAFDSAGLKRFHDVNLCLAVDTPRGLTVPVFHKANELTLAQIATRRSEVVDKARNNRLTPQDLGGGTFTVSNLGMFGIDVFNAIVNPPQAAILAVGRIAKRPMVVDDALELRPTVWVSLSVDHRVADGATAARFFRELVYLVENPYQMMI